LEGNYEPNSRSDSPTQRASSDPEKAAARTRVSDLDGNRDTVVTSQDGRSRSREPIEKVERGRHGGREVSEGGVKPEGMTGRESRRELEGMAQQR
jgi:hypothetical protein